MLWKDYPLWQINTLEHGKILRRMEEKTCYGLPATPSPHLSVSLLWEEVRNVGS